MKGDFSRFRHDPKDHYFTVLRQQGRVDLDSDWNEYVTIREHLARTRSMDIIGPTGVPRTQGGFKISKGDWSDLMDLKISRGRIYVDGILCETDGDVTYKEQPFFPDPPIIELEAGKTFLVMLVVWDRHVTSVEDSGLLEPALRGPDTTTRMKTVWQVMVLDVGGPFNCLSQISRVGIEVTPMMSTMVDEAAEPVDPCDVREYGGYRGLENRLYRVEIHDGGSLGTATFKWSRDNAAIVFPARRVLDDARKVKLARIGSNQDLVLAPGDVVEVTDEATELMHQHGMMAYVIDIDRTANTVTLDRDVELPDSQTLKLRRWDQRGAGTGGSLVVGEGPIQLENGISVSFGGGNFQTGDYWTFWARRATGQVEHLEGSPPDGIEYHSCRLAIVRTKAAEDGSEAPRGVVVEIDDCRPEFPEVTDLTSFFYLGGDGQEAFPNRELREPLRVGVANGRWPVSGARVRFTLMEDYSDGYICVREGGNMVAKAKPGEYFDVLTDEGVAECIWVPGAFDGENPPVHPPTKLVRADLLDAALETKHLPIHFTANLSMASETFYDSTGDCPRLKEINTVQGALDLLCKAVTEKCAISVGMTFYGQVKTIMDAVRDPRYGDNVNICLLPMDHLLDTVTDPLPERNSIKITGSGPSTSKVYLGVNATLSAKEIIIRDVCFMDNWGATSLVLEADRVIVENCRFERLMGFSGASPLVTVTSKSGKMDIKWNDNYMIAKMVNQVSPSTETPIEDPGSTDYVDFSPTRSITPDRGLLPTTSTLREDIDLLGRTYMEDDKPAFDDMMEKVAEDVTRLARTRRANWSDKLSDEYIGGLPNETMIERKSVAPGSDPVSDEKVKVEYMMLDHPAAVRKWRAVISKDAPDKEEVKTTLRNVIETEYTDAIALMLHANEISGWIRDNDVKGLIASRPHLTQITGGAFMARAAGAVLRADRTETVATGIARSRSEDEAEVEVEEITPGAVLNLVGNRLRRVDLPIFGSGMKFQHLNVSGNTFESSPSSFTTSNITFIGNTFHGGYGYWLAVADVYGSTSSDRGLFSGNMSYDEKGAICTHKMSYVETMNLLQVKPCEITAAAFPEWYLVGVASDILVDVEDPPELVLVDGPEVPRPIEILEPPPPTPSEFEPPPMPPPDYSPTLPGEVAPAPLPRPQPAPSQPLPQPAPAPRFEGSLTTEGEGGPVPVPSTGESGTTVPAGEPEPVAPSGELVRVERVAVSNPVVTSATVPSSESIIRPVSSETGGVVPRTVPTGGIEGIDTSMVRRSRTGGGG